MPKCSYRGCGHVAETLGTLRRHYTEAGHKTKKRAKRDETPPPETAGDTETTLLTQAVELFSAGGTDSDADERVIRYLITRFAPSIGAAASDGEAA